MAKMSSEPSKRDIDECTRNGGVMMGSVCVIKLTLTLARGAPCENPEVSIRVKESNPAFRQALIAAMPELFR
jgi:hypothetical protein